MAAFRDKPGHGLLDGAAMSDTYRTGHDERQAQAKADEEAKAKRLAKAKLVAKVEHSARGVVVPRGSKLRLRSPASDYPSLEALRVISLALAILMMPGCLIASMLSQNWFVLFSGLVTSFGLWVSAAWISLAINVAGQTKQIAEDVSALRQIAEAQNVREHPL